MVKLSVIIPTRNRHFLLKQLLQDLSFQTIKDFEIIVVDQSEDLQQYNNVIHIKNSKKGPCVSRNLGVARAQGEILVFLDDDARVRENFLKEITEPIRSGKSVAVAGAICDLEGRYLKCEAAYLKGGSENFIKAITDNPDSQTSRFTISLPGGCSAILKDVFVKLGGFDEGFDPTGAGEDRDLALNLHVNGYAIWYNSKAKLMHIGANTGGSRDVGSRSEALDINTYKICRKYFSRELAESLKKTVLNKYRQRVVSNILIYRGSRSRVQQYFRIKEQLK